MYNSDSESSSSDSTSFSSSLDHVVEEFEDLGALEQAQANSSGSEHGLPNEDDPIADEAYQVAFDKAREERNRRKLVLKDRFQEKIRLEDWLVLLYSLFSALLFYVSAGIKQSR
eukprot:Seg6813.1 transcript_id=Seg6813.1/GoldUCD/mRNA.D3Y31 product="hypothetical protein" protein_id=Seg6813.1/GoldUCD/D3Y31